MDIEKKFQEVISKLQSGQRALDKLSEQELDQLNFQWQEHIKNEQWPLIIPILCILDNTITLSPIFYDQIITTIQSTKDSELIVLSLGLARKQIIEEHHKRGHRVPFGFIKLLKELLKSKDPEVFEWTLRLIEALGSQSIILKPDVLAKTPGLGAIFNQHKKASKQIIELLRRRWT